MGNFYIIDISFSIKMQGKKNVMSINLIYVEFIELFCRNFNGGFAESS